MNKRGVSPLIATVLLIAFAVSMGAVIMNLGANLANPCEKVEVEIFTVDEQPLVCFNRENKVAEITINNLGDIVDGFKITATGNKADSADIIEPLGELEKSVQEVRISGNRIDTISVAPLIEEDGKYRICKDQARDYINIPSC